MAEKSKLKKKDTETILNAFIVLKKHLKKKEKVQLIDFGTFEPRNRAARIGRNLRTKEEISIQESVSVRGQPSYFFIF